MTTIDHEGRPQLQEAAAIIEDDAGSAERLNQEHVGMGTELVPFEQADELEPRPITPPPVLLEGKVLNPADLAVPVERRVLPLWLRDEDTFRAAAVWAGRRSAHLTAFHGVRLPLYWLRLVGRSPVGLGRIAARWSAWVSDAPGRAVRENLASGPGITPDSFYRVTEQHRDQVRGRLALSAAAVLGLLGGLWALVAAAPGWVVGSGVVFGFVLLGLFGRSPDRPVTSRSVDTESVPRLTEKLILTALAAMSIGELNRAVRVAGESAVRFPAPITRDGPGWRADIDLPPGVTAGDVIERRDRLASGLRRPVGCVWPETDHDAHAGRLILWVGDRPMSKAKPVVWSLTKTGTVDLFAPFPIGVDPRGRVVTVTLMFALMVIGAIPRMGKSFLLRLLLLAAALDVRAEVHIYDLKGGADMLPLEQVAHRFRIGDDNEDIAYLLSNLRELGRDMTGRYKTVRSLPRDICPEGKITPELAGRRDLGLYPVVLALDECQRAFEHAMHGAEIEALITDLAKRGPAVGIIVILATQRPDAKSLPTGISSNAVLRFCLRVAGQTENDMVLGTSAYKNGVRATMFARGDVGVGYLSGEADDPTITRTAKVDAIAAEQIAARARGLRIAADRLTGHAAGVKTEPDAPNTSLLEHLVQVWPVDQDRADERAWWDDLAARLADTYPGLYHGWAGPQLSAAAKAHGLKSVQVKRYLAGQQVNRRGLARQTVMDAIDARNPGPEQLNQGGELAGGWPQLPAPEQPDDVDRSDLR